MELEPPLAPADVVAWFSSIWAEPAKHGYQFLRPFSKCVELTAPLAGRTRGTTAGYEAFRRTFFVLPDLHATVDRWAFDGTSLFIAMRFHTAAGGPPLQWRSVDELRFDGEVIAGRRAYFDPSPVARYILRHPRLMLRWLRARLFGAKRWPNGVAGP